MKKYFSNVVDYLVLYLASMGIGLLFYIFGMFPVELLFDPEKLTDTFIRMFVGGAGVAITAFLLSFRTGYKQGEFLWKTVTVSILCVLALQQIVAPILQYLPYISSTSREMGEIIYLLQGHSQFDFDQIPYWVYHLCMLVFDCIFILLPVFAGNYLGVKKRHKDRKKLHAQNKGD